MTGLRDSTFAGPARWATDSTNFGLHNVVLERATFDGRDVPTPARVTELEVRR